MFSSNGALNATTVRFVLLIPVIALILVIVWLGVIKIIDKIVLRKIVDSTKQIEDDILFIESLEETRFDNIHQAELSDSQLSEFIGLKEEAQGGIKALNKYKRSKKKTIRKSLAMGSYINELAEYMGEALHPMFANLNEDIKTDVIEESIEEISEPSLAYKDQTPNLKMFVEEPNSMEEELLEQEDSQDQVEELLSSPANDEDAAKKIEEDNVVESPVEAPQQEEFSNQLDSSGEDINLVGAIGEPWEEEIDSEPQIIDEEASKNEEMSEPVALEDNGIAAQVLEFKKLIDEVDEPNITQASVDEVIVDTISEEIESQEDAALLSQRNLFAELLYKSTKPKTQAPIENHMKEDSSISMNYGHSQVNVENNVESEAVIEDVELSPKQDTKQNLYQRDIKADHIIGESDTYSILQSDVTLRGNIEAKDALKVYGSIYGNIDSINQLSILKGALVEGNITSNRLFIELANVYGDIRTNQLLLDGNVVGDIVSTDTIVIGAFAKLRGNVISPSVEIRQGAQVQGHFEIGDEI